MNRKPIWIGVLLAMFAVLAGFSVWLALNRIYQVDECQNLYMARVLATSQATAFFTSGSLFLLGPLSWITKSALSSADMFTAARLLFLTVFWLNIVLLTLIVGQRLLSIRGLVALMAAATLAPLWDYGFEIRHDNLVLTGVLVIWWAVRAKPMGIISYALTGIVTITMLFVAVKTIVYAVPLSAAVLLFPPPAFKKPRWQLALAWLAGALFALVSIRICYGTSGAWDIYLRVFRGVSRYTAKSAGGGATRFWPWETLSRLLWQTPLLLALTTAACLAIVADFARRGKAALSWNGNLPEMLLLLGALAALFLNPTPFPYNLVNLVPFAFLLAFKYGAELWNRLRDHAQFQPFVATVLVFGHVFPFGISSERHLNWPNARQRKLMSLAETMTNPAKDPVYDGVGMVLTRPSIDYIWYLHSLNIQLFLDKAGHHVRDLLAKQPAAVLIPNYRTDWLPGKDHQFIERHYVPLADDFWVLGTRLPAGGGAFEIFHAGRYCFVPLRKTPPSDTAADDSMHEISSEINGRITGTLDGAPLPNHPVELGVGSHRLITSDGCQSAVVWVGPHLDHLPHLKPGNHQMLFVNWY